MPTIEPYDPLNTLKPFGPDIWVVDGGITHMSYFGSKVPFPTRMAVVKLSNGGLWVWSPVEGGEDLFAQIEAIGPVAHIVSPNAIHYEHIPQWAERFPHARVWASPGVRNRSEKQGVVVAFDQDLLCAPPPDWSETIDQTIFKGSRVLEEVVFFHKPSGTLILADLIENFEAEKLPLVYRLLAKVAGTLDPDGKAPLDLRMGYLGRKTVARKSLEVIRAWQPQRIIMAHGRCITSNGEAEIERAFRWLN